MKFIMTENAEPLPIICRYNPRLLWIAILGFFEAIFMFIAPFWIRDETSNPNPLWPILLLCWPVAGLIGWGTIYILLEIARGEVRADETGLRWRSGMSGWKSARWEEISDFYLGGLGPHAKSKIVETPAGKLELNRAYSNIELVAEVAEQVRARAVNARARDWEQHNFRRDENWSLELSSWTKKQKWSAPIFALATLYVVIALPVLVMSDARTGAPAATGLWPSVIGYLVLLFFFSPIFAAMIWVTTDQYRERNFAWRQRAEILRLDAAGLIFRGASARVAARWDEVQIVERLEPEQKRDRVRVATANGDFVLWNLTNSSTVGEFRHICEIYAPTALEALKQREQAQALEAEYLAPATDASGAQVFDFRTRSNRLITLCVSVALLFAPLIYLINIYANFTPDAPFAPNWRVFGGALALCVTLVGALCLWFRGTRIVADERGLRFHSPFRRARFVAWQSIGEVGHDAWGDWLRADERRIYFARAFPLAHRAQFDALLERFVR